jgi:hypothetical protein
LDSEKEKGEMMLYVILLGFIGFGDSFYLAVVFEVMVHCVIDSFARELWFGSDCVGDCLPRLVHPLESIRGMLLLVFLLHIVNKDVSHHIQRGQVYNWNKRV